MNFNRDGDKVNFGQIKRIELLRETNTVSAATVLYSNGNTARVEIGLGEKNIRARRSETKKRHKSLPGLRKVHRRACAPRRPRESKSGKVLMKKFKAGGDARGE